MDKVKMVGINDDVLNVGVYQWLIQMVPCDFESMLVLKEGEGNNGVMVATKRNEL
jgi:hypothetical protein